LTLYDLFNRASYAAYELLGGPVGSYCRLETLENDETLAADDGSLVSALKIEGTIERVTPSSYERVVSLLTEKTRSIFERPGQSLKLVFEYDPARGQATLADCFEPTKNAAQALGLDLAAVLNGWEKRLSELAAGESFWLALWTRASLLDPADRKRAVKAHLKDLGPEYNAPGQRERIGLPELKVVHQGALLALSEALTEAGLINRRLKATELLRDLKATLFPQSTPFDWTPTLPGIKRPFILPDPGDKPDKVLAYPSLASQIFSRPGTILKRDFLALGDRLHAPFFLAIPPREPKPFNELFRSLARARSPWRLAIDLSPGDIGAYSLRSFLAKVFALTSIHNRQFSAALESLKKARDQGACLVAISFTVDTWVETLDHKDLKTAEIALRRQLAELERLFSGWGQTTTQEITGDPLLGLTASLPGVTPQSPAPKALAPLEEAYRLFPLRPASAWATGPLVFLSPDGKPWPFRPNSSNQAAWIDLGVAPMGAGKSVLLNAFNLAFCLQPGLTELPLLSIVDVGPSSMGLITLLKNALPPHLKPQVAGYRLRSTPEYAINPLDAPLGLRAPLPGHLGFLVNLLCLLATPLGQSAPPDGAAGIARVALEAAYAEACNPGKLFDPLLDPELTDLAFEAGFEADSQTTFWDLTDFFFQKGQINEAFRAQRYASPTLAEVAAQIRRHPGLKATYGFKVALTGENVLDYVWRALTEALGEYKILAKPTRFGVGEARVVSLDLDEVAPRGGGPAGDKRAAVMYMLARHAVGSRFFLTPADATLITPLYRDYHQERLNNLRRIPKRLCYDEVHRLTGLKAASEQLVGDLTTSARESRKWNLSIGLYSQAPEDFPPIFQELATAVFVLGAGSEAGLAALTKTYGFNESVAYSLARFSPPGPKGSSLAALFKTQSGRTQDILTLALSPELRWAFSTTAEDASIRDELYKSFGVERTLSYLAKRWPNGLKAALEEKTTQKDGETRADALRELIAEAKNYLENSF
jgi:intracellular multiplication protein IcmB